MAGPLRWIPPLVLALSAAIAATAPAAEEAPAPFVRAYDTKTLFPAALPGEALAKCAGWLAVPEDNTSHKFAGDAVLANDKLAVVLRRAGAGAELYSAGPGGTWHARGVLAVCAAAAAAPAAGATIGPAATAMPVGETPTVTIVENTPGAAMLAATFRTKAGSPATARFRLTAGLPIIECRAADGTAAFEIRDAIRYLVVPELLAQDCVLGPAAMTGPRTGIPAENTLMALLGEGEAIGMFTWRSNERNADGLSDRQAAPAGATQPAASGGWTIRACRVECRPGESIWYSILQAPGIWCGRSLAMEDLGKTLTMDWKPPFLAKWRCGLACSEGQAVSGGLYEMPSDGKLAQVGGAIAYCVGSKLYTARCGFDPGQAQPRLSWIAEPAKPGGVYGASRLGVPPSGLAFYPIDRNSATGTAYCPIDVIRDTLGLGACQYILEVEGLGSDGEITPQQTGEWLVKLFERKRDVSQAKEIRRRLAEMRRCIAGKASRIRAYEETWTGILEQCRKAKASSNAQAAEAAVKVRQCGDFPEAMGPTWLPEGKHRAETAAKVGEGMSAMVDKLIGNPDGPKLIGGIRSSMEIIGEGDDKEIATWRMTMRRAKQCCRDLAESHPQAAELLGTVRAEAEGALRKKPSATADKGDGK
jgi:hypothetical protein